MYDKAWIGVQSLGAVERSRYSIDVTDLDTLTQRIKDKERDKMAQCQHVKKKKEYEELKECTFTPAIKRNLPKQPPGPIVVRGLGRHLELKELAQRQAEDKARRHDKAFLTNVSDNASKPYTVPSPFHLSSNDKKHEVCGRTETRKRLARDWQETRKRLTGSRHTVDTHTLPPLPILAVSLLLLLAVAP